MARIPRKLILYDGCYAHVFSRSIEKRRIFETKDDFEFFKNLLFEVKETYQFRLHHYCLLNTHFHLVVMIETTEAFSKALQLIKKKYTHWYNVNHKRFGPLWRDRFKSLLIEDEAYLYACGLYIERNPVKAGLVSKAEDWEYSSSAYYFLGKEDPIVEGYDLPTLPKDFDINDTNHFIRGIGIGRPLFKLYLKEGAECSMSP